MKTLRFLPLTFLAGVHGFVFFAPYLAVFLAVAHWSRRRQKAQAALVPAVLPVPVRV